MSEIKAIETYYKGYRFRSRLEARWAVFFDAAGIKYEYEPEGFEVNLSDEEKIMYLPDFYLPDFDVYAEVKPSKQKLYEDGEKISWCIDYNNTPISKGLLILGQIPYWEKLNCYPSFAFFKWDNGVGSYIATIIRGFGKNELLIQSDWDNEGAPELPDIRVNDDLVLYSDKIRVVRHGAGFCMDDNDFAVMSYIFQPFYKKARQARFEHGECG